MLEEHDVIENGDQAYGRLYSSPTVSTAIARSSRGSRGTSNMAPMTP